MQPHAATRFRAPRRAAGALAVAVLLAGCADHPTQDAGDAGALSSTGTAAAPVYSGWLPAEGSTLPADPVLEYTVSSTEPIAPGSYQFTVNGADWRANAAPPTLSADGKSMRFWSNVVNLQTGAPMTFRVTYCTTGGVCTLRTMGYNGAPTGVGDQVTGPGTGGGGGGGGGGTVAPVYTGWAPAEGSTLPHDPVLEYTVSSTQAIDPASYRFTVNGTDWRANAAPPTLSTDGKSMRFWSNVVNLQTGAPMVFRVKYCTTGGTCTLRTMGYNGAPTGVADVVTNEPDVPEQAWGGEAYGIIPSSLFWGEAQASRRIMDDAATMGARWLRATVYWYIVQPDAPVTRPDGTRDLRLNYAALNDLRTLAERAAARGMRVHLVFEGTPQWARPGTNHPSYAPHQAHWHDWADFVRAVVNYIPEVQHWSPWNEPNATGFLDPYPGSGRTRAREYAHLLGYAADAIRSRAGNQVLGPDLAAIGDNEVAAGIGDNMELFLRDVMTSHSYAVDVITVHHYNTASTITAWVNDIPGIMQSMGLAQRDIWLTEFNGTADMNDAQRGAVVRDVLLAMRSGQNPHWKKSFVYQFDENAPGAAPFRMVDRDTAGNVLHRYLSWHCFRTVAAGHTVC